MKPPADHTLRNKILGISAVLAILIWQTWLGYLGVTPVEVPQVPDPQTIILNPAPVEVQVDPSLDPAAGLSFGMTNLDELTVEDLTATGNIILQGTTYTRTAAMTITGFLTNVRLIYYQVP